MAASPTRSERSPSASSSTLRARSSMSGSFGCGATMSLSATIRALPCGTPSAARGRVKIRTSPPVTHHHPQRRPSRPHPPQPVTHHHPQRRPSRPHPPQPATHHHPQRRPSRPHPPQPLTTHPPPRTPARPHAPPPVTPPPPPRRPSRPRPPQPVTHHHPQRRPSRPHPPPPVTHHHPQRRPTGPLRARGPPCGGDWPQQTGLPIRKRGTPPCRASSSSTC